MASAGDKGSEGEEEAVSKGQGPFVVAMKRGGLPIIIMGQV